MTTRKKPSNRTKHSLKLSASPFNPLLQRRVITKGKRKRHGTPGAFGKTRKDAPLLRREWARERLRKVEFCLTANYNHHGELNPDLVGQWRRERELLLPIADLG